MTIKNTAENLPVQIGEDKRGDKNKRTTLNECTKYQFSSMTSSFRPKQRRNSIAQSTALFDTIAGFRCLLRGIKLQVWHMNKNFI